MLPLDVAEGIDVARLVYEHLGTSHECEIADDELVVGRAVDADLTIESKAFSRKHFRVFRDGLIYYVEDLHSSNGTRLEADRLADQPTALVNGARIVAGGIAFVFDDGAGLDKKKPRMASTRTKRIVVAPKLSTAEQLPKLTLYPLDGGAPTEHVIQSSLSIGRKEGNDLVINEKVVSGKHCTFERRDGALVLTDHGSSNGTFVNGAGIGQAMLKDGDTITLGKQLRLVVSDPSSSNQAATQDRARLVFQEEEGRPAQDAFIVGRLSVGREDDNQLVIIDPVVSAHHCVIEEREDGFFLSDLGSGNGTSVAGEKVTTDFPLMNGDVVTLGGEIQLFFVNPESKTPVQEDPQPAKARKAAGRPRKASRKLPTEKLAVSDDLHDAENDDASSLSPTAAKAGFALSMVISITVAVVLVAAGFLVPAIMSGDGEAIQASSEPAQDPTMSFEAEGELGGWKVEASDGVMVGLDKQWVYDGKQALVLHSPEPAPLIRLTSLAPVPINLQGKVEYSLGLEGKARSFRVVLSLTEQAGSYAIGGKEVHNISTGSWGDHQIPCTLLAPVGEAHLSIEIMNLQGSLRLDGIRIAQQASAPSIVMPLLKVAEYTLDSSNIGAFYLSKEDRTKSCWLDVDLCDDSGRLLPRRFVPDQVSNDLRSTRLGFYQVEPDGSATKSSLRVTSLEATKAEYQPGVELQCQTHSSQRGRRPVFTFSVEKGVFFRNLRLFDAYGNQIPLQTTGFEPLRGVAEISSDDLNIAIVGKSAVELRPAQNDGGGEQLVIYAWQGELSLHLNALSQSRLQLYEKIARRIDSLAFDRQMSSAIDHAYFLAGLEDEAYKSFASQAKIKLAQFDDELNQLWLSADTAMRVAHTERNLAMARQALSTLVQIQDEFPQDARASQARYFSDEMKALIDALQTPEQAVLEGFRRRRPPAPNSPEVLAQDESEAATLFAIAERDYEAGNWLRAYLFADNIAWNYHYTDTASDAKRLADRIQRAWDDEGARTAWVQGKLDEAKILAQGTALKEALEVYRAILRRYPSCPESKDVLREIRELEAIGG